MKDIDNINFRKSLYRKSFEEAFEINYDNNEEKSESVKKNKTEIVSEIKKIFSIKKPIHQNKEVFRITKVLKDSYTVKFSNIEEKNEIFNFSFLLDNVTYEWESKIISINKESNEISFLYPESISCINRRTQDRYPIYNEVVGIFWHDKEIEFLGEIMNISKIGLGLEFSSDYFDFEFFKIINNEIKFNGSYKTSIIFSINNEYISLLIEIKHIAFNEKENVINLGCEFIFNDDEDKEKVNNFIIDKKTEDNNKKIITNSILKLNEIYI